MTPINQATTTSKAPMRSESSAPESPVTLEVPKSKKRAEKGEKAEKAEKAEKTEKTEKADKPEKLEKPEKTKKPSKVEANGQPKPKRGPARPHRRLATDVIDLRITKLQKRLDRAKSQIEDAGRHVEGYLRERDFRAKEAEANPASELTIGAGLSS